MKPGQPTVSAQKTAVAATRVAAMTIVALATALAPLPPDAATMAAESDFPHANAVVAEIARPHTEDKTPDNLGFADRVQDWLARANREYQTTVIPRLSIPSAGGAVAGDDAIAKKLEEVKEQDAEAAEAAARATEALKAAEAKQAEEARQRAAEAKRAEDNAQSRGRRQACRRGSQGSRTKKQNAMKTLERPSRKPRRRNLRPAATAAADCSSAEARRRRRACRSQAQGAGTHRSRSNPHRGGPRGRRSTAQGGRGQASRRRTGQSRRQTRGAKLAEAKLAEERQRVAAVEAEKNTTRQIEITPEPIPPAGDAASQKFPAENNTPETDEDLKESAPAPPPRSGNIRATSYTLARGPPSNAGFGGCATALPLRRTANCSTRTLHGPARR